MSTDITIYMPLNLWYELVFVRLPLDDLARLRRVCKSFAQNPRFITLIKARIEAAFSGIERRHWNNSCATYMKEFAFLEAHHNKFARIVCERYYICPIRDMGVFSSKERLLQEFMTDAAILGKACIVVHAFDGYVIVCADSKYVYTYTSVNDEILSFMKGV